VSMGCGRKRRSGRAWRWIGGVQPPPKAGNKPWQHCIVHGLAQPGSSATVSEFGTYFIGYARSPRRIEQMLENMFVGRPPGNYDRLLDFSRAVTGTLFFVPSATFLDNVAPESVSPSIGIQTLRYRNCGEVSRLESFVSKRPLPYNPPHELPKEIHWANVIFSTHMPTA